MDVAAIRRVGAGWRVLVLQRAPGHRRAGAWEIVHGSVERRERPTDAARRELLEETGLRAETLFSITVNPFYLATNDTVQMAIAFAAVVSAGTVQLGPEHVRAEWVTVAVAKRRLAWPRTHELLDHIAWLLRAGDAGAVDDVLRVGNNRE